MNAKVLDFQAFSFEKKVREDGYRVEKDSNRKIKVLIKVVDQKAQSC